MIERKLEWMTDLMNEFVHESLIDWYYEWRNEWMNELISLTDWMNDVMNQSWVKSSIVDDVLIYVLGTTAGGEIPRSAETDSGHGDACYPGGGIPTPFPIIGRHTGSSGWIRHAVGSSAASAWRARRRGLR